MSIHPVKRVRNILPTWAQCLRHLTFALVLLELASCNSKTATAETAAIIIDAAKKRGASNAIHDFLAVQGGPATVGQREEIDKWVFDAWHAVGFKMDSMAFFGSPSNPGGIKASRNADGKIDLDFSEFDGVLPYVQYLGWTKPFFQVFAMPKDLSSAPDDPTYYYFAPKDYNEWCDVISRIVRHIKEELHLEGASYCIGGEPDTGYVWRGKPGRSPGLPVARELLDDYVDLYLHAWRAIKAVDPKAKIGGPGTISYSSALNQKNGWATWGLDDFLKIISDYNQRNPKGRVTVDEVVWQDYNWERKDRLSIGVEHVRALLPRYGFPPDTPLVIVGWNTNYGRNPDELDSPQRCASFFASNIIHELNPGGIRGLSRAYLWPFDSDGEWAQTGIVIAPTSAATPEGYHDGSPPATVAAVTEYCKRPSYAAFQMLRNMTGGDFILVQKPAGSPLEVLSTLHHQPENSVIAILVNHSNSSQQVAITFKNLPFKTARVKIRTQRIDGKHSSDCKGLEDGQYDTEKSTLRSLTLTVDLLPYSIVQMTLIDRAGISAASQRQPNDGLLTATKS